MSGSYVPGASILLYQGPLIKAKSKEVANNLKYEKFNVSNGWLQKLRKCIRLVDFRALPDKMLELKSEKCVGVKCRKKG